MTGGIPLVNMDRAIMAHNFLEEAFAGVKECEFNNLINKALRKLEQIEKTNNK